MEEPHFIDQTINDIKKGIKEKSRMKQCVEFEGSLYEELKYRCSPERYMEPYNPKKVDLAADLYAEVLKCDEWGDKVSQVALRKKASLILGVKFSTRKLYEELREKCNPENFISQQNYDAEKVKLANSYYQKINECCDDIDALERLEKEIIVMFPDSGNHSETNTDNEDYSAHVILVLIGLIGIVCIMMGILNK